MSCSRHIERISWIACETIQIMSDAASLSGSCGRVSDLYSSFHPLYWSEYPRSPDTFAENSPWSKSLRPLGTNPARKPSLLLNAFGCGLDGLRFPLYQKLLSSLFLVLLVYVLDICWFLQQQPLAPSVNSSHPATMDDQPLMLPQIRGI